MRRRFIELPVLMYVLGLNAFLHDASATLLRDGVPVAAAEEERFSRRKHTGDFPEHAIRYCLAAAGITPDQVDRVAFYMKPGLMLRNLVLGYGLTQFPRSRQWMAGLGSAALRMSNLRHYFARLLDWPESLFNRQIVWVEHHLAHAASAFFCSPYDEAAFLSVDGAGEWTTTLLGAGRGTRLAKLSETAYPHSLGFLYSAVTRHLGFRPNTDEYKVMGLASYGKPAVLDRLRPLVRMQGGTFRLDLSYFTFQYDLEGGYVSAKFAEAFGPPRRRDEPIDERHRDLAASLQGLLEAAAGALVDHLHARTGLSRLCIAGGVGLNTVMNGHLLARGPFKEIFVQPAAYDAGTSLGAAQYVYHVLEGKPKSFTMDHVLYGPAYSDAACKAVLEACRLPYQEPASIESAVARLVAGGQVVGWFQGPMEFGPRALGCRSILADARRAEMKDVVNLRIKKREDFRPFAPSVLEEKAGEYFDLAGDSPFMILVCPVRPEKRAVIPAVTHVDGTARVHTVKASVNPRYHRLIREFETLTGVPVVLNTSFNLQGEPIVCTPEDALRCFYGSGLDALALGPYLITKAG